MPLKQQLFLFEPPYYPMQCCTVPSLPSHAANLKMYNCHQFTYSYQARPDTKTREGEPMRAGHLVTWPQYPPLIG